MIAIVKVESGGNPLAINVNGSRRLARQPRSRTEAMDWSRWLIRNGYSIDMGLTQVNSGNLGKLNTSISAMFDPCANLAAGASILASEYSGAARRLGSGQDALRAALSAYNTGNHRAGIANGYVARVAAAAHPDRRPTLAPPLRIAAMSADQASISPRVFWARR
jgi:type IV secretion system protein VirB1